MSDDDDNPTDQDVIRVAASAISSTVSVRDLDAREYVGRPFIFEVQLTSTDPDITFTSVLGTHMTLETTLPDSSTRYLDGIVTQFVYVGEVEGNFTYQATLRPWLWLLTRNVQTRIYQSKTAKDIIKDIFTKAGFDQFDDSKLMRVPRTLDYCVQYQESDFNFVSRLMEQEGIYYFFTHPDKNVHKLILADDPSAHEVYGSFGSIPYFSADQEGDFGDAATSWIAVREIQSGKFATDDYDFTQPSATLLKNKSIEDATSYGDFEIFEYPGRYIEPTDGQTYADLRMEEQAAKYARSIGQTKARWICAGSLVTLTDSPRDDQNCEYLVLETKTTRERGGQSWRTQFRGMPTTHTFRMPRVTPRPFIRGPQTAIVTGKSGEEIWTDQYARVKVQFHWDRDGKNDDTSSCWIRCAQPWAGKQWGSVFIPRIGQEVVVHFLEGDPDQPIITGAVYNGPDAQPSPITLPDNATQSTIKTNSSKGGNGFNQIKFEDLAGSEQFYEHAQKDYVIEVENNHSETVKAGSRSITVSKGDETKTISQGNQTFSISQGAQTITVNKDQSITINTGNHSITVSAGASSITANTSITFTVGGSSIKIDTTSITLTAQNITVNAKTAAKINGTTIDSVASGDHTIKGATVDINGA
jgi:type VI secretion system secreted protein VgrG